MGRPLALRSDDELLAASPKDPEAFGVFYRRHASAVLSYLLRSTRDPERSLDLTAETFAAALESCGRFRPAEAPARAWLFGIARNKLAESHRRRAAEFRARRRLGIPRIEFHDEDLARLEELLDDPGGLLAMMLGELTDTEREAVDARYLKELEYSEVAAHIGCSEPAARQRVSRGLSKLAARMRGLG